METGSIAKWSLSEGERFDTGTAICEVETDKATVTYEATEEGYLAKILVGSGEVKVRGADVFGYFREVKLNCECSCVGYASGWTASNDNGG